MRSARKYYQFVVRGLILCLVLAGCEPEEIKLKSSSTLTGPAIVGDFNFGLWVSPSSSATIVLNYPQWTGNTAVEFRSTSEFTNELFSPIGTFLNEFSSVPILELKSKLTVLDTILPNINKWSEVTLGIRDASGKAGTARFQKPYETYSRFWGLPELSRHRAVALTGKSELVIIGGILNDEFISSSTPNVQKSLDGINWTTYETSMGSRADHAVAVMPDPSKNNIETIWVIGGRAVIGGGTFFAQNDVMKSTDGITWTEVVENSWTSGFPLRWGHTVSVMKDPNNANKMTMWVIGGEGDSVFEGIYNDVWKSADGVNWTQVTTVGTKFTPRRGHQTVVMKDQNGVDNLWLIGGYDGTNFLNDIWKSTNGINWTKIATPPFSPRADHQNFLMTDPNNGETYLWLIGGNDNGFYMDDVWKSPDAVHWTRITNTGQYCKRNTNHQVVVFQDPASGGKEHMFVIGGELPGYIAKSPDGTAFQLGITQKVNLDQ